MALKMAVLLARAWRYKRKRGGKMVVAIHDR
jgi:hypothetical protein